MDSGNQSFLSSKGFIPPRYRGSKSDERISLNYSSGSAEYQSSLRPRVAASNNKRNGMKQSTEKRNDPDLARFDLEKHLTFYSRVHYSFYAESTPVFFNLFETASYLLRTD